MSEKIATILGATGLTGNHLAELLSQDDTYDTIRLLVRRPIPKPFPKTEIKLIDFSDYESFRIGIEGSEAVFCAVGTTQKKVKGNKEAYRKVDYDIPMQAARICKDADCKKFIIVSSVGADAESRNFYLQLKGEVERDLKKSGIQSIHIMQPGMLLGKRNEKRLLEAGTKPIMKAFSVLLKGGLSKYKPIHSKEVAMAMLACSKDDRPGYFVHQYNEMKKLSTGLVDV
jgi:uncharacterized protein YbjT (DUF2867 family)